MGLNPRLTSALTVASVLVAAPSAGAATTATGSSSVTANVTNSLAATFPTAYAWGSLPPGVTNSAEQVTTVYSNAAWGVQVSSDRADGRLHEWDGAAYVAASPRILTNALQWSLTSVGGSPQTNGYTSFSSTPALIAGSQTATDDTGRTVGVTYRQNVSYADRNASPNSYRIQLSYTAQQGF